MVLRHKAAFLHAAHKYARPQHMQVRLRERHRQQHTAAVHHSRAVNQRREILPGKRVPCCKALGRTCLPCLCFAAALVTLHRFPAGTGILAAGCTGIRGLGRLAALSLGLFARSFRCCQPELFFGSVLALCGQNARSASFDEPGHKVALAALTGPDTAHLAHIQRQAAGAVGFALTAKGVVHISQGIRKGELRVALQECRHLSLVLLGCKGAGGIHQLPARGQHSGCTVQNFCTQLSTLLHQRFTVLLTGHRLLAEHSLAGTGRVHQHPVKKFRQRIRNAGGRLIEHHCIGHAHAFQIAFQDIRTSCNVFVAHQHTPALQRRRQLAAFAAGRGAHVQHTHPGLHAQQRCRRGRRRLLRVEHARMVVRMPPGPEFQIIRLMHHECRLAKGRCFQWEIGFCGKLLR